MHDTCIIFSQCIYVIFCHFNIIYKYIIVTLYNNSQINILAGLAISSHRIYIITSARKFVIIPRKYKLECLLYFIMLSTTIQQKHRKHRVLLRSGFYEGVVARRSSRACRVNSCPLQLQWHARNCAPPRE